MSVFEIQLEGEKIQEKKNQLEFRFVNVFAKVERKST